MAAVPGGGTARASWPSRVCSRRRLRGGVAMRSKGGKSNNCCTTVRTEGVFTRLPATIRPAWLSAAMCCRLCAQSRGWRCAHCDQLRPAARRPSPAQPDSGSEQQLCEQQLAARLGKATAWTASLVPTDHRSWWPRLTWRRGPATDTSGAPAGARQRPMCAVGTGRSLWCSVLLGTEAPSMLSSAAMCVTW